MAMQIPRREALRVTSLATVSVTASCGFFSTDKADENDGAVGASYQGKEAPMLSDLVKSGKLPQLAKRLPRRPFVLTPFDGPGPYGGTLRRTALSQDDKVNLTTLTALAEWDPVRARPIPGLAEKWEVSEDSRTYTFHLREGLRWSDGHPYTTDDVLFAVQHVFANTTLWPAFPSWLAANGEPPRVERVDATTIRFRFAAPMALLLEFLPFQGNALNTPAHYLQQFHPDFVGDDANATAKDHGFQSWDQYYVEVSDFWRNSDLPVLYPWRVTTPFTASSGRATFERNPYYYKTDNQGRQLPYVDRITYDVLDQEASVLRAAAGEIDLQSRNIGFRNASMLVRNAQAHDYRVLHWHPDAPWIAMFMNQSAKDPAIRQLMQNLDFRAALSHAVDRDEMNQTLYVGLGGTEEPVVLPQDRFAINDVGQRFTSYDEETANRLLDKVGLDHRDDDGMRLRPDGQQLELVISTFPSELGVPSVDAFEMVTRYWKRVGVNTHVKNLERSLWVERAINGDLDIPGYSPVGYLWEIDPSEFLPVANTCYWAPLYGSWYASGGSEGERPPAPIARLQRLYDELKAEPDPKRQLAIGRELVRARDENVWVIGTVSTPFLPVVANSDLMNVRTEAIDSYSLGHEQATLFEQVAYRHPEQH